jgi:hypothetical protein
MIIQYWIFPNQSSRPKTVPNNIGPSLPDQSALLRISLLNTVEIEFQLRITLMMLRTHFVIGLRQSISDVIEVPRYFDGI